MSVHLYSQYMGDLQKSISSVDKLIPHYEQGSPYLQFDLPNFGSNKNWRQMLIPQQATSYLPLSPFSCSHVCSANLITSSKAACDNLCLSFKFKNEAVSIFYVESASESMSAVSVSLAVITDSSISSLSPPKSPVVSWCSCGFVVSWFHDVRIQQMSGTAES